MTCLVETIQHAFEAEVANAEWAGGEVACTIVVDAIVLYCKLGSDGELERIVDDAYTQARSAWGNEWRWQAADVAERVCDGLRVWVAS